MSQASSRTTAGFTLLELVVVLGIIAVVTGIALRTLDGVADHQRYEANQRILEDIRAAILGSPDDRTPDGLPTINGFVADMNRLPRTKLVNGELTLAELWVNPNPEPYGIRRATSGNVVPSGEEDPDVYVPGGWRGPYLRLPIGTSTLRDGWGNPMTTNPSSPENGRLRDRNDQPILAEGEDVHFIATLGANGVIDSGPLEREHDAELVLNLKDFYTATLSVQIEATEHDGSVDPITGEATVRVFAPHPSNPEQIQVYKGIHIPDSDSSPQPTAVVVSVPNLTIGARIVRAYLSDGRKSVVRQVVLRPGANFIQLKIDR